MGRHHHFKIVLRDWVNTMERDHQYPIVVVCWGRGQSKTEAAARKGEGWGNLRQGFAVVMLIKKGTRSQYNTGLLVCKLYQSRHSAHRVIRAQGSSRTVSFTTPDPHFHLNPGENRSWGMPLRFQNLKGKGFRFLCTSYSARTHYTPLFPRGS